MKSKKEKGYIALFCLAASALIMLLCTQSSPLFPLNTWVDSNCLLTVGRMMKAGGVVYRDICEQKGPTLYLLHLIATYMSETSFLGVYVLEVLSFAAVLYLGCLLVMRKTGAVLACSMTALVGACVIVGRAFMRGDSAEEFCLPLLMGALYLAFSHYGCRKGPMGTKALFVCGLLAGLVATIKFTILGLFIGLCIAEGVLALREDGFVRALRSAGVFLAGMLLPIFAWCVYFALHGALDDFYTVYIYNNIFLYTDEARTLLDIAHDISAAVRSNFLWVLAAGVGMLMLLLNKRETLQLRLALLSMAICTFVTVFFLGRTWLYSPLVLGVYALAGLGEIAAWIARRLSSKAMQRVAGIALCALTLAVSVFLTPNVYLRGLPASELAQTRLAAYIHEGATLLQYSSLDDGLYLVSGCLPQHKYFARLNVPDEVMQAELDRYVAESIPDYVLTSWNPLPEQYDHYQLIATDVTYDSRDRLDKLLYLYRRR